MSLTRLFREIEQQEWIDFHRVGYRRTILAVWSQGFDA
jgi:hypothetical protein